MRRFATLAAVGLLVLLVAAQFALPPIVEGELEERLTESGGSATVELSALPAVRLLFTDGDVARVRARGLELPLVGPREKVLEPLDGFDEVDIEVTDSSVGPVRVEAVTLQRAADAEAYRMTLDGSVTLRDIASAMGGFLGGLAGGAMPFGDEPVAIDLDGVIRSDGGRPRAVAVEGDIAGIPAGPLIEALAQAVAGRF
jgi:hypothetical protein